MLVGFFAHTDTHIREAGAGISICSVFIFILTNSSECQDRFSGRQRIVSARLNVYKTKLYI